MWAGMRRWARGLRDSAAPRIEVAGPHLGLAVQKPRANRNDPSGDFYHSVGLAVQKPRANRNGRGGGRRK